MSVVNTDDEIMTLMKKYGTWYVPTISAGKFVAAKAKIDGYYPEIIRPKAARIGGQIQDTFAQAYKAGVKIGFGTDQGVAPHGENAKEFGYMVEAGMPAAEAIQAATLHAADLLGWKGKVGVVQAGAWGDLVGVTGDPTRDVTLLEHPVFVMKGGETVKAPE